MGGDTLQMPSSGLCGYVNICVHTHIYIIKVFKISRKVPSWPWGDLCPPLRFFGAKADLRQWEECKQQGQGTLSLSQDTGQSGKWLTHQPLLSFWSSAVLHFLPKVTVGVGDPGQLSEGCQMD